MAVSAGYKEIKWVRLDISDLGHTPFAPLAHKAFVCMFLGMGAGINVTGKLEAGKLQNGDKVVVMPAGEQGLVKGEYVIPSFDDVSPIPSLEWAASWYKF